MRTYRDILHSNSRRRFHNIRWDSTGSKASSHAEIARSNNNLKLSSSPDSIKSLAYATMYAGHDINELYLERPSSNTRLET